MGRTCWETSKVRTESPTSYVMRSPSTAHARGCQNLSQESSDRFRREDLGFWRKLECEHMAPGLDLPACVPPPPHTIPRQSGQSSYCLNVEECARGQGKSDQLSQPLTYFGKRKIWTRSVLVHLILTEDNILYIMILTVPD